MGNGLGIPDADVKSRTIMSQNKLRTCSTVDMIGYSMGDIANSLVLCSLAAFAMLFYTKALGLNPVWAGIIMASSTCWDAISDPIMGHISDNTRSKYGRRHPYMLVGGVMMVVTFFFFWTVPGPFLVNKVLLITYLTAINIMLRTAYTIYVVPFTALGFEICQDYTGRTKLQSIKTIIIMLANLSGPAMAWSLFFKEVDGAPRALSVSSNYLKMSTVFSLVSLAAILFMFFYTKKNIRDSRTMKLSGATVKDFFIDMKEIIMDRYFRWVFVYVFSVLIGIVLVSSLQMYVYEDYMKLGPVQKTFTHGGTMVGMMLGASFASIFARCLDKKGAVYIGGFLSTISGIGLAGLFLLKILEPGEVPAVIVFALLNGLYWFGNGIMFPVAASMIADISEINEIKTGINKDGAYAAVYSFANKLSQSAGILVAGICLTAIGFVDGVNVVQTPEVVMRLFVFTFVVGPLISLIALTIIKLYPVNKGLLQKIRAGAITGIPEK